MQLFVRAQQTHVVDVTGDETVGDIKVRVYIINLYAVLYAYLSKYLFSHSVCMPLPKTSFPVHYWVFLFSF